MKRSRWKGPLVKLKDFKEKLLILPRNYTIIPLVVGLICEVHSGKKLIKLSITEEMIGYKVGEFVPTRERFEFEKKRK